MTDVTSDVDHRHLDHPSVVRAAAHYSGGSDEASHEHRSMFARAFEKIENLLGLTDDGFMSAREMNQCHDEFYLHGGDTQAKTSVSIDRIAAAAACEAGYAYERHANLEKFAEDEEKSIHFMVGFAMAEAIKLFEQLNNRRATTEEREQIASSAGAHAKAFYEQNHHSS